MPMNVMLSFRQSERASLRLVESSRAESIRIKLNRKHSMSMSSPARFVPFVDLTSKTLKT